MSDNNDYIPELAESNKDLIEGNFFTFGNIIEKTAAGCIATGDANYIGDGCRNISILNSSGCITFNDVKGGTIINSSGIILSEDNLLYINNVKITGSASSSVGTPAMISTNYTLTSNDDVVVVTTPGVYITVPLYTTIGNKRWYIKNVSGGDIYIVSLEGGGFDDTGTTTIISSTEESYTIQTFWDGYDIIL